MSDIPREDQMGWPPGLAGRLAQAIYSVSQRPVLEISVAAAFALLAGVCGRAFTINGTGLNLYVIVVARSAIGKEAIGDGIAALMALLHDVPGAKDFVESADYASGPALQKAVLTRPSFVQVAGEFGRKLKMMSGETDSPHQTLRTFMTKAYSKSGPGQRMDGLIYSDREKSLPSVDGHAFSFIGESTPGSFSAGLTTSMMEDGFLSRFNIISYVGERPPANLDTTMELEPAALQAWRTLAAVAVPYNAPFGGVKRIPVQFENLSAEERLCQGGTFDEECDREVRAAGDDEGQRQMWNRAHLKALRMSAVMAAADNPVCPKISLAHAVYAITAVKRDIAVMKRMIQGGEVGSDDHARTELVRAVILDFFGKPIPGSYGVPAGMKEKGIIPHKYIYLRVIKKSAFGANVPKGSIKLLDEALKSLTDAGDLLLIDKAKLMDDFAFAGKAYRITGSLR